MLLTFCFHKQSRGIVVSLLIIIIIITEWRGSGTFIVAIFWHLEATTWHWSIRSSKKTLEKILTNGLHIHVRESLYVQQFMWWRHNFNTIWYFSGYKKLTVTLTLILFQFKVEQFEETRVTGWLPEQCFNNIVIMREQHCWTNIIVELIILTILFNIVSTILFSIVSTILFSIVSTILFIIVSTILLNNDDATRLFMAVGTEEVCILIEQPCSLLLTSLFQLVNKLLQQWWLNDVEIRSSVCLL